MILFQGPPHRESILAEEQCVKSNVSHATAMRRTACLPPPPHPLDESMPPSTTGHRKKRRDDTSNDWYCSKSRRVGDQSAVERVPLPAQPRTGPSRFSGAYEDIEGNALKTNNRTTRTSDFEEFLFANSVPVDVLSLAQGPWPMIPSSSTPRRSRRLPETYYMGNEHSGQLFPAPAALQSTVLRPFNASSWNAAPAHQQVSLMRMTNEYGANPYPFPIVDSSISHRPSPALTPGGVQTGRQHRTRAPYLTAEDNPYRFPVSPTGQMLFQDPLLQPPSNAAPGSHLSMAYMDAEYDCGLLSVSVAEPSSAALENQEHRSRIPDTILEDTGQYPPKQSSDHGSSKSRRTKKAPKTKQKRRQAPTTTADHSDQELSVPVAEGYVASLHKGRHYCALCDRSYGTRSDLTKHRRTNTHRRNENPGKPVLPNYRCPKCPKGFSVSDSKKRHMTTMHGVEQQQRGEDNEDDEYDEGEEDGEDEEGDGENEEQEEIEDTDE